MKNKFIQLAFALILIALVNVGIFCLDINRVTTFWICYCSSMIAAFIFTYVKIFYLDNDVVLYHYAVSIVSLVYLGVTILASVIMNYILAEHSLAVFIIELAILAAYLILFFYLGIHYSHVNKEQLKMGKDIQDFNVILGSMKEILDKIDYSDPNKKRITHTYDALAGSPVRSNESVKDIEISISMGINKLKDSITGDDNDKILECLSEIEDLVSKRNKMLSKSKLY